MEKLETVPQNLLELPYYYLTFQLVFSFGLLLFSCFLHPMPSFLSVLYSLHLALEQALMEKQGNLYQHLLVPPSL